MSWEGDIDPPYIDPGSGVITLYHRVDAADGCQDAPLDLVALEPCGVVFPELESRVMCAAYQLEAQASDPPKLDGQTSVQLELGKLGTTYRETGCGIDGERPFLFSGLPVSANINTLCEPSGEGLSGCPQAVSLEVTLAASLEVGAEHDLCDESDGGTRDLIEVSELEVSVQACELRDGEACSPAERDFVAAILPRYTVTGTRTEILRLDIAPSLVDCAVVRSAAETSPSAR